MVRFRLTPAERRARVSEGRWGWVSPKRLSRREFIGLRDRMYQEKKRMEMARTKGAATAKVPGMPVRKRRGIIRWLIFLLIIAAIVYFYLKKIGRI